MEEHERPEKTVKIIKESRRGLMLDYLAALLLFYFSYRIRLSRPGAPETVAFILTGIFLIAYGEIRVRYKRLIIYNKRAVLQEGLFHRHSMTINYSDIIEVAVNQGFLQRYLGIGDLIIRVGNSRKDVKIMLPKVAGPIKAKKILHHFALPGHKV